MKWCVPNAAAFVQAVHPLSRATTALLVCGNDHRRRLNRLSTCPIVRLSMQRQAVMLCR